MRKKLIFLYEQPDNFGHCLEIAKITLAVAHKFNQIKIQNVSNIKTNKHK